MTEDKRSPLHDWHEAHGAETIWEDGYPSTNHEGRDPHEEYEAVRTATGIWDLFSTCKYEVNGPDAARLIQRRFTNSLAGMQPGQVRYGAFVNADGLMVDDGNVYEFADDRFWVLINTADLADWFRETATGLDATIEHRTDELAMIAVQGPTSQQTLQGLVDRDLGALGYFRFWTEPVRVAGVPATVMRTGFSGEHGYEIVTAVDDARTVWAALAERGANPPKRFKTLQIEGDAAPDYGAAVTKDGREVGTVTSPASSPRLGTIGLAVMDADVATDGEKVEVAVADGTAPAVVAPLSLLDPEKRRPRD